MRSAHIVSHNRMEYFKQYLLFLTLYLSFSEIISSDDALSGRASMYQGFKVFTVEISSDKDIEVLENIKKKYQEGVEVWSDHFEKGDFVIFHVEMNYVPVISDMLKKNSVEFKTQQVDMEHKIREEISYLRDEQYEEFGYNYAKHNPFSAMQDLLKGLTDKYRRISKLEVVGSTVEKRPVFAVHISKTQSKTKPVIVIECGIHAREWSAFEVCFYIISELLKQKTEKVQKLTSMYDFVILPALNPDGYVYSWTKDRMWRKNRSCDLPEEECKNICIGVDINRNFDVDFEADDKSKMPCTESYRGKSPFSERESQVVKKIVRKLKNRLLAYICFHSYLSVWAFPWAKTKELPENYKEMERVAKMATDTLQTMTNNTAYKIGSAANKIYAVPGTSADYAYDVGGAKYAFNVELRQGKEEKGGFIMNEDEIIPLCEETFAALGNCVLAMQPSRK